LEEHVEGMSFDRIPKIQNYQPLEKKKCLGKPQNDGKIQFCNMYNRTMIPDSGEDDNDLTIFNKQGRVVKCAKDLGFRLVKCTVHFSACQPHHSFLASQNFVNVCLTMVQNLC
jgi:hypothetical protein